MDLSFWRTRFNPRYSCSLFSPWHSPAVEGRRAIPSSSPSRGHLGGGRWSGRSGQICPTPVAQAWLTAVGGRGESSWEGSYPWEEELGSWAQPLPFQSTFQHGSGTVPGAKCGELHPETKLATARGGNSESELPLGPGLPATEGQI